MPDYDRMLNEMRIRKDFPEGPILSTSTKIMLFFAIIGCGAGAYFKYVYKPEMPAVVVQPIQKVDTSATPLPPIDDFQEPPHDTRSLAEIEATEARDVAIKEVIAPVTTHDFDAVARRVLSMNNLSKQGFAKVLQCEELVKQATIKKAQDASIPVSGQRMQQAMQATLQRDQAAIDLHASHAEDARYDLTDRLVKLEAAIAQTNKDRKGVTDYNFTRLDDAIGKSADLRNDIALKEHSPRELIDILVKLQNTVLCSAALRKTP